MALYRPVAETLEPNKPLRTSNYYMTQPLTPIPYEYGTDRKGRPFGYRNLDDWRQALDAHAKGGYLFVPPDEYQALYRRLTNYVSRHYRGEYRVLSCRALGAIGIEPITPSGVAHVS